MDPTGTYASQQYNYIVTKKIKHVLIYNQEMFEFWKHKSIRK